MGWLLLVALGLAAADTRSNGLFLQKRIGQFGKPFVIFKFRTIHPKTAKVSAIGAFFRKYKIDEWPQLYNVLIGNMSFVGPRPDISGYYDRLEGDDLKVLELKPGITSRASIKYANEEQLLSRQQAPLAYNDEIIFPDKVKMNLDYFHHQSLWEDIRILWATIFR